MNSITLRLPGPETPFGKKLDAYVERRQAESMTHLPRNTVLVQLLELALVEATASGKVWPGPLKKRGAK